MSWICFSLMLIVLLVVNVQSDENVDFALSMQRWDFKLRRIYFPWIFPLPQFPLVEWAFPSHAWSNDQVCQKRWKHETTKKISKKNVLNKKMLGYWISFRFFDSTIYGKKSLQTYLFNKKLILVFVFQSIHPNYEEKI